MFVASTCVTVHESSEVGHARRIAREIGGRLGFSEMELGTVGIAATEMANNLVKHAQHGQLLLRELHGHAASGLELLAIDRGPGMADVARCLADGYSTAGSPGTGLGAISRAASLFDVYSQPGRGTVMVVQIWTKAYRAWQERADLDAGAVSLPVAHERESGDGWILRCDPGRARLMLVDGLGHGEQAAQAAVEAVRIFEQYAGEKTADLVQRAHRALGPTRGAALAVLDLHLETRELHFLGVGNISGRMWGSGGTERNFVSSHGIVGHSMHTTKEYVYPWPAGSVIVMATDGLTTRWNLDDYPGLRVRHPAVVAGVLYRDFGREKDDATVVALRERHA